MMELQQAELCIYRQTDRKTDSFGLVLFVVIMYVSIIIHVLVIYDYLLVFLAYDNLYPFYSICSLLNHFFGSKKKAATDSSTTQTTIVIYQVSGFYSCIRALARSLCSTR